MVEVDSSDPANKKTINFSVVNPRFEAPIVGGFYLNGAIRGSVDADPLTVHLTANTSVTTAVVDDLSQVTDSGPSNKVRSRTNFNNDYEGFGHNINVVSASGTYLQTAAPGDGEMALIVGFKNEASLFATRRVKVGPVNSGGPGLRAVYLEN